jgi:hypothetical protein
MTYLFILIAVAAVAGPLLSALPSKQQRRVARWRDAARNTGILVRCREPAEIPPRLQRISDEVLVCYAMRCDKQRPETASQNSSNSLWVRTAQGWESRDGEGLPEWLDALDSAIEAITKQREEVQVYWTERGQDSTLEQVFEALNRLKS